MRSFRRLPQAVSLCVLLVLLALAWPRAAQSQSAPGYALRFYGHGASAPDLDRVKILIDPVVPADVGATDLTIEVWLKTASGNNAGAITAGANTNWINGNIFIDRDIYSTPAYGDFGLSLGAGRVAFGVETGQGARTIVGTTDLRDGAWHHVAATRNPTTGQMRLFVDGVQEASATGPTGDASYADGRGTNYPNSDPYLVLGAEKHDVGSAYPAFKGWLDELRLSRVIRYTGGFTRPDGAFATDGETLALYHFDEGPAGACTGTVLDSSGASGGPSHGQCGYGGSGTAGPAYSTDTPFGGTPEPTAVASMTRTRTPTQAPPGGGGPTATRTPTRTTTNPPPGPYRVRLPALIKSGLSAMGMDVATLEQPAAWSGALYLPMIQNGEGSGATGDLSLRFYGHGASAPDLDRVKILIDPVVPADVGATDLTIEVWLKTASGNTAGAITAGANTNWINGNIFIDRDIYNAPAYGDFGLSLGAGRVAFGVETGQGARTIVGTTDLRDGAWHHVAVTRNPTTGQMRLFVDGVEEASATGPTGDASYADERGTNYPNSDPYLVLGAEKHDVGSAYPAFSGWLDELRLSRVIRYTGGFTRPDGAFATDGETLALYHFDEGPAGACTGTVLDSSGASGGPSHGQCGYGGSGTAGPAYSTDTPP